MQSVWHRRGRSMYPYLTASNRTACQPTAWSSLSLEDAVLLFSSPLPEIKRKKKSLNHMLAHNTLPLHWCQKWRELPVVFTWRLETDWDFFFPLITWVPKTLQDSVIMLKQNIWSKVELVTTDFRLFLYFNFIRRECVVEIRDRNTLCGEKY